MRNGPTLLIDVGGVLLKDPMKDIFDLVSARSGIPRKKVTDFYSRELRQGLWEGSLSEEEFWQRLLSEVDLAMDVEQWRGELLSRMTPLTACKRLPALERDHVLWILSNHRSEWLRPRLQVYRLDGHFEGVLISSETGHVKPNLDTFRYALGQVRAAPSDVVFIDDKSVNLRAAQSLGIGTCQADDGTNWVDELLLNHET